MGTDSETCSGRGHQGARQQLLDAAAFLFSQHGLDAVSIRTIAEDAGVAHSSVRYHFQSKQELYDEVLLQYGPRVRREQIDAAYAEEGDADSPELAERRLHAWISDLLQAVGDPLGISDGLMMKELCRQNGPSDALFNGSIEPHHNEVEALLAAYRPDWDARTCRVVGIGIIAQAVYFRIARPVAERLLAADCLDTTCAGEVSQILARTILDGVRPR